MQQIILMNPFDAHCHWRQKSTLLERVAPYSTNNFAGSLLMPNTDPKITSLQHLQWYRGEVLRYLDQMKVKHFIMFTYYLSEELSLNDLQEAWKRGWVHAVKYYPKGGTTASEKGLNGFAKVRHLLEYMEEAGIPLLIHGEIPMWDDDVVPDNKREPKFIEQEALALREELIGLKITLEHISTKEAAQFALAHPNYTRATITPQHITLDDRALMNGVEATKSGITYNLNQNGARPKYYCRPILQTVENVNALREALTKQASEGLDIFGLGTDSAAHENSAKYRDGCACGQFNMPVAHSMYATAFEAMGILDHYEKFACDVMPEFYLIKDKLPSKEVVLVKEKHMIEPQYSGIETPFGGQDMFWKVAT